MLKGKPSFHSNTNISGENSAKKSIQATATYAYLQRACPIKSSSLQFLKLVMSKPKWTSKGVRNHIKVPATRWPNTKTIQLVTNTMLTKNQTIIISIQGLNIRFPRRFTTKTLHGQEQYNQKPIIHFTFFQHCSTWWSQERIFQNSHRSYSQIKWCNQKNS